MLAWLPWHGLLYSLLCALEGLSTLRLRPYLFFFFLSHSLLPPTPPRSRPPETTAAITLPGLAAPVAVSVVFEFGPPLPGHANGLTIKAMDVQGQALMQVRCSGGRCNECRKHRHSFGRWTCLRIRGNAVNGP